MLLNENIDPNNQKWSQLEKGDIICVISPGKEYEYANIVQVFGNEIFMFQPKSKKYFKFNSVNAIEGNIFTFYAGKSSAAIKMPFAQIFVQDSNGSKKFSFTPIEPKEDGGEEEEEISPELKQVREVLERERSEIFGKFQSIEEGDTFSLMFGEVNLDSENLYTGKFKENMTSQAFFKCNGIYEEVIIAKFVDIKGAHKNPYQPYLNKSLAFSVDERGLFNIVDEGVSIKTITQEKEQVNFQYVYYMGVDSSEDDESSITKVNPEFNHDLMRLIHHRTWKDRLLGRDGKGIVPLEKLRKKYLGGGIKGKKYVKFTLDRDVIIGTGNNLKIKKNQKTFGKMYDSGRIVVYGKNGKQTIHLFLKNTNDPDIYTVKIQSRDSNNNKETIGSGKLTIVD